MAASLDSARAWLIVAATFLSNFVVFGLVYSFGVFLKPMSTEFGSGAVATSALFAITTTVYYSMGAITGHVADRFDPRVIVAVGAMVLGGGLCLTALTDDIWLCYVAYGIGIGVGGACCYLPTVAIGGSWFNRHRNSALSSAVLGVFFTASGFSALIGPLLAGLAIDLTGNYRGGIAFALAIGTFGFIAIAPLRSYPRPIPPAEA